MARAFVSVEPAAIASLGPSDGVELVRGLLWAEASRLRVPRTQVFISADITVPDGGIDASIQTEGARDSILVPGSCHYQVKTGASFKPWQRAEIQSELFGARTVAFDSLGAAVRMCLEAGATYSLIAFGHDLTTERHALAVRHLREFFTACGHADQKISVIGSTQIAGMLALHPSLCLDFNGLGNLPFQTIASWAKNSDMTAQLALGVAQEEFIAEIQRALDSEEIHHVRIVGEPGIGKSRLVLEAIVRREDFSANALYVRQASDFQNSALFTELLKLGNSHSVLLVIDECDDADRTEIWRHLKNRNEIKLVTIDHGPETGADRGMVTLHAPSLEIPQIQEILRSHIGEQNSLWNWAAWCDGSARVAQALGENLRENPEDILRTPGTVLIWERFIAGYEKAGGQEANRLVLMHIALFEKFGSRAPVLAEAQFIAKLVAAADPSITQAKFDGIVAHYKTRRILQGDRTLRIVPKALQVHLWKQWWEAFGASANPMAMMEGMPESLYGWFMRPFIYAHDVEAARDVVRRLLDPRTGLFADRDFLISEKGARFVSVLAEADPAATLSLLRATIPTWSPEALGQLGRSRQTLAWALEKIGVWKTHFRQAAKTLLALSRGDTSTNGNNAKGIFNAFFSPYGAPTEATFADRLVLVKELLASDDSHDRAAGLSASACMFRVHGGGRIIGVEYQGLRPQVQFWQAKLTEELVAPWQDLLLTLMRVRFADGSDWNLSVDKVLIDAFDALAREGVLLEDVIAAMDEVAASDEQFEPLLAIILSLLRHRDPDWPDTFLNGLRGIDARLSGPTFAERLRRRVLSTIWEDFMPDVDRAGDPEKVLAEARQGLASEAAENVELLLGALPDLMSSRAHQVESFGFEVASAMGGDSFDTTMLACARGANEPLSPSFLSGYLRGAKALNLARWESLAEALVDGAPRWIMWSVICSGMSPKIFELLRAAYVDGKMDVRCLLPLGRNVGADQVSIAQAREMLRDMLARRDDGFYSVALQVAERNLCQGNAAVMEDEDLGFAILTDEHALDAHLETMDEHYWNEFAKRYRTLFPSKDLSLLSAMVSAARSGGGIAARGHVGVIAAEICGGAPAGAWPIVSEALLGEGEWAILRWLGANETYGRQAHPPILKFAVADILSWIDVDPPIRARRIAGVLPKSLDAGPAGELGKAFLAKYADLEGIGGSVISRFHSGVSTGHRSDNLKAKLDKARQWMGETDSPVVQDWLEAFMENLRLGIDDALIWEERGL